MPIARIRNDIAVARIRNDSPTARISSFTVAETSRSSVARGSAIGILLAITRGIRQSLIAPSDVGRPAVRIRNTD